MNAEIEEMKQMYKGVLLLVLTLLLFSCRPQDDLKIMTVNGAVFSSDMGTTLIHEHVMVDWIGADSTGYNRWDRTEVVERVKPYFLEARQRGVHTIIEYTPAFLGRDPFILSELSRQTGVQIITNTGYYGAVDNIFIPAHAYEVSAREIAAIWIDEFVNGIDGSELRPGFIKISVATEEPLSNLHQKIVDAAAITHLETGMTIASHTIGDVPALEQIERIKNNGVFPDGWIWTHAQSGSAEANIEAASEGAWISLDNVNTSADNIEWYADRIERLKNEGFLNQILVSHDAGWYDVGEPKGGDFRGYTDIFDDLLPVLSERKFTDEDIHQLLVKNPQQAFSIRVRALD